MFGKQTFYYVRTEKRIEICMYASCKAYEASDANLCCFFFFFFCFFFFGSSKNEKILPYLSWYIYFFSDRSFIMGLNIKCWRSCDFLYIHGK